MKVCSSVKIIFSWRLAVCHGRSCLHLPSLISLDIDLVDFLLSKGNSASFFSNSFYGCSGSNHVRTTVSFSICHFRDLGKRINRAVNKDSLNIKFSLFSNWEISHFYHATSLITSEICHETEYI